MGEVNTLGYVIENVMRNHFILLAIIWVLWAVWSWKDVNYGAGTSFAGNFDGVLPFVVGIFILTFSVIATVARYVLMQKMASSSWIPYAISGLMGAGITALIIYSMLNLFPLRTMDTIVDRFKTVFSTTKK